MTSELVSVRSHPDCLEHVPPLGHPDTPARLRLLLEELADGGEGLWELQSEALLPPEADVCGALKWIHEEGLIDRLQTAVAAAPTTLDGVDNPVSPGTWRAAVAAAGLALQAGLDMANGRLRRGFLAVRPPGHQAEPGRARGFCFFNSAALAAELLARAWQGPVLVVDVDAAHGGGTQRIFWERPDVGFVSVHRYPSLFGTGTADELGGGRGRGTTRNVPLAEGSGDAEVVAAVEAALDELGSRLRPLGLVVSAGFSAHRGDPLGGLTVTDDGFARITRALVQASETWCGGRILSVLEGGWSPRVVAAAARRHVAALAGAEDGIAPLVM